MPAVDSDLLRDMALFVEVAKRRSFRGTAAALRVSPSLLSRRVSLFEKRLGVQLLKRTTRSVELTELGSQYLERSQELIERACQLNEELRDRAAAVRGPLRIAATLDLGAGLLGPLIGDFLRRNPGVSIELDAARRPEDLVSCHLDLLIHVGSLSDSGLVAHHLLSLNSQIYGSHDYLRGRLTPRQPQDLLEHECLRLLCGAPESSWVLRNGEALLEVPVRGRLTCSSLGLLHQLVLDGVGVGILPDFMARASVASGRMTPLLLPWRPAALPGSALTAQRLVPATTRAFIRFLRDRLTGSLLS